MQAAIEVEDIDESSIYPNLFGIYEFPIPERSRLNLEEIKKDTTDFPGIDFVLVTPPIKGCYGARITSFNPNNKELNRFLTAFDIWCNYRVNINSGMLGDEVNVEVSFDNEFWDFAHTKTFKRAIKSFGATLVFELPYTREQLNNFKGKVVYNG